MGKTTNFIVEILVVEIFKWANVCESKTNVYIVDGKCQCKFFKSMLEAPSSLIHIMATVDAVKSCMSTQTLIDRLQQRTAQFRSPNYDKLQVCCFCWFRLAILQKFLKQKTQTKIAFQHQPQARISKENYRGITVGIQPPPVNFHEGMLHGTLFFNEGCVLSPNGLG